MANPMQDESSGTSTPQNTGNYLDGNLLPQRPAAPHTNPNDAAPAGPIPKMDNPAAGVGSIGNPTRPFKL